MVLAFAITSTVVVAISASVQFIRNSFSSYVLAAPQPKENVTITALFNQFGKEGMGKSLVDSATDKVRSNHPDPELQENRQKMRLLHYNRNCKRRYSQEIDWALVYFHLSFFLVTC